MVMIFLGLLNGRPVADFSEPDLIIGRYKIAETVNLIKLLAMSAWGRDDHRVKFNDTSAHAFNPLSQEIHPMMKHVLAGCSLLAVLVIGSLPVAAQSAKPAPSPAPAQSAPNGSSTATPKVSPEELKKFAGAAKQMVAIVQDTENQMVQIVQKQGFTEARFNEIYKFKRDPNAKPATQVTPQEEQKYNQTVSQLSQIQKDAQSRMDKAVEAQGLPLDRFNQIFALVQNDPQLRQEVRKMMQ